MSATIRNIGLYLSKRIGIRTDYKLILSFYIADHTTGGVPNGTLPLAVAERKVDDIDSDSWYCFNFDYEIIVPSGYYCITLHQQTNDVFDVVDFKTNFVQWIHTSDRVITHKDTSSFSSNLQFSSDPYGYGFADFGSIYSLSEIYGFGYGYGDALDSLNFFNVFEANGDFIGYSLDSDPNFYGYSYGFEGVDFVSDDVLQRTFKIYEDFNDIDFIENGMKINIPAATESTVIFNNRQDFLDAELNGTDVINNFIALQDYGDRIFAADCSVLNSKYTKNKDINWFNCNLFLSSNDIVSADLVNPLGNINEFGIYLVASVYYSGIFLSFDGGSSWKSKNNDLTFDDNSERNFSCVKFGSDASFIIIFDDTNSSEKGKVFRSNDFGENWNLISSDLIGLVVNDLFIVNSSEMWAGTSNGIYKTIDGGITWNSFNSNLPNNTKINQVLVYGNIIGEYGYGYGGGEGVDYFDVLGFDGSFLGYGVDGFELTEQLDYTYGYEYGFSGGDDFIAIIATDRGVYWLVNGDWKRIYPDESLADVNTNTVLLTNNEIFIGKDDGLIRSDVVSFEESDKGFIFKGHSVSDALSGDFYIQGLLRRKTTKIISNKNSNDEIFISQYGGVYISKNSGGNFINSTKKINERSLKIKDILLNPLNNNIVYFISENTKFSNAGVTIVVDCSGSMAANDPGEKRIDMALNIVSEISSAATNTPYFQIIRFGVSEFSYEKNKPIFQTLSDFDVNGAFNLTRGNNATLSDAGYSADINLVNKALDISCREPISKGEHSRTLLFDTIAITAQGLINDGSRWVYQDKDINNSVYKYNLNKINSNFYWNLDKSLIILTDGHNTVIGKTIDNIISNEINFGGIPSEIYIVGIGNDINYENLKSIKQSNKNAKLYLAQFDENILSNSKIDVSDIIINKEKFRKRSGTWKKIFDLSETKIVKTIFIKSNVPPNTTINYRVRSTNDLEIFSDFTDYLNVNIENNIKISGRYIEVDIYIESDSVLYSPEVTSIEFFLLKPSESFIAFPLNELDSDDRISEIELSSLDDISMGNISNENLEINFGIVQSKTTNFDLYDNVRTDKRSVMVKRTLESLVYEDGFFFKTKNGPWAGDASVKIFDAVLIEKDANSLPLDTSLYYTIPDLGLVVFFDEIDINKSLKIVISNISSYRIGLSIKNLDDSISQIEMHDIAWTFHSDSTSKLTRPALPKVLSQISDSENFGVLLQNNYRVSSSSFDSFLIQYILQESFAIGTISLTTGERINLKTIGSSDIFRFYDQNFALDFPQIKTPTDKSYLKVTDNSGKNFGTSVDIVVVDPTNANDPQINYQINVKTAGTVQSGDSVIFSLGDKTQGSLGISTRFHQSNLLFNASDYIVGGIKSNFYIGDALGNSTPSINGTGDLSFDKIIDPSMNFIGQSATKLVIITPSTIQNSEFLIAKIIAVDNLGLVDEQFAGTILFGFKDKTFGTFVDGFKITFSTSDLGVKNLSAVISSSASGSTSIQAGIVENETQSASKVFDPTLFDNINTSNTFVVGSSKIRWGDLNTSSIFSDGRQDIDFIANYAKNFGALDFVGITDDLDQLDNDEWNYTFFRSEALTNSNLVVLPGFKYRTNNFYGERMILFGTSTNPTDIITKPSSTQSEEAQILNLINSLSNSDFISIPVHSPYKTDDEDYLFRGRGFVFERYRNILTFGNSAAINQFIKNNEVAAEVYSEHGNFETSNIYQSENFIGSADKAFESSAYVQHALLIGKKFGFIASSGGYHSRTGYYAGDSSSKVSLPLGNVLSNKGLTAVLTNNISRGDLIDKIKARKCYATTGARMFVSFSGETLGQTAEMGDALANLSFKEGGEARENITLNLRVTAHASNISRIEIIKITVDDSIVTILDSRNTALNQFNKVSFGEDSGNLQFVDTIADSLEVVENKELCYYVRFTQEDGHIAWSSPIWFNYGRIEGIRLSSNSTIKTIYNPISSSIDTGTLNNIPYSVSAFPPSGSYLPNVHIQSFFTNNQLPRGTYSDRNLFVDEKNINIAGLRIIKDSDKNIIYGTHFLKFMGSRFMEDFTTPSNDYVNESLNPSSGQNGTGANDPNYKFLTDSEADTIANRPNFIKRQRSYFFGHAWQYSSSETDFRKGNFSFEGDVNTNTIITSSADNFADNSIIGSSTKEKAKIVMKPFLYQESSKFYLFYSSSVVNYPEDPVVGLGGIGGLNTYKDSLDQTDPVAILSEETVGLSKLNNLSDWAGNFRIHFATAINSNKREDFIFNGNSAIPNNFSGDRIWFMHSPNLIKLSGDITNPYRLYFLGYLSSDTSKKLKVFCYQFANIQDPSGGVMSLCFTFDGISSSLNSHNFTPYSLNDIRDNGISNLTWPEDPYYAIGTNWLSVVEFDDGNVYGINSTVIKDD